MVVSFWIVAGFGHDRFARQRLRTAESRGCNRCQAIENHLQWKTVDQLVPWWEIAMEQITLRDPRQWLAAVIYFVALYFPFEAPLPVALGLSGAVVVCWALSFGRHWIMNVSIAVMLIGFAVAAGWVPHPAGWSPAIARFSAQPVIRFNGPASWRPLPI
jgi:hypothetical protein